MTNEFIDYSALVDEAMHVIVKKSLEIVATNSFCGDHHFFISFLTIYPDVEISDKLRNKYPEEMTIVLQYQYEDLIVEDSKFSVTLSFDNVKERIVIPFKALTAFADPSVKFGLQFRHYDEEIEEDDLAMIDETIRDTIAEQDKNINSKPAAKPKKSKKEPNNVIALDSFRKKR